MTDKVQKIREEVARIQLYTQSEVLKQVLDYIDEVQKESVNEELEEACELLAENAMKHKAETISPFFSPTDYKQGVIDGANWKEYQMMSKAIDGKVIANGMGNPILHLWDKGKHLIDKEVKVIVVKED